MYDFAGSDINTIWLDMVTTVANIGHHTLAYKDKSTKDQDTLEILHTNYTLLDPRQRLVHSYPVNPAFLAVEIAWILAGRFDVAYLDFWNPRMKTWSDDGIYYSGAYGHRIMTMGSQFKRVYETLKQKPSSRHGVLQIWEFGRDLPNRDGTPISKDVPCNIASMLRVHDDQLYWMQTQRSQDAVWGMPTNAWQWTILQEVMAGWLGMDLGYFSLATSSFHIYERHWDLAQGIAEQRNVLSHIRQKIENAIDEPVESYPNMPYNHSNLAIPKDEYDIMLRQLVLSIDEMRVRTDMYQIQKVLGEYYIKNDGWRELQTLCCADALRRTDPLYLNEAMRMADEELPEFLAVSYKNWVETL